MLCNQQRGNKIICFITNFVTHGWFGLISDRDLSMAGQRGKMPGPYVLPYRMYSIRKVHLSIPFNGLQCIHVQWIPRERAVHGAGALISCCNEAHYMLISQSC